MSEKAGFTCLNLDVNTTRTLKRSADCDYICSVNFIETTQVKFSVAGCASQERCYPSCVHPTDVGLWHFDPTNWSLHLAAPTAAVCLRCMRIPGLSVGDCTSGHCWHACGAAKKTNELSSARIVAASLDYHPPQLPPTQLDMVSDMLSLSVQEWVLSS